MPEGRIELPWGAHVPFADPASIPPPIYEVPTEEASGEVEAGRVLRLDTVPHEYMADVPLVDDEWVDRQVLVLAEYGALLQKHGYEVRSADDDHPQAWSRVSVPRHGQLRAYVAELAVAAIDRMLERKGIRP